jgi:hypothetical protein
MNKKAFLLFDVTLAIAMLSLGLVFVIRSISMSMKVAKASLNYSQAIGLAYEKAFDIELESQLDGLEIAPAEGAFPGDERFNWEYSVEKLEEDLGKLILGISWQEAKRESGFEVTTYVKTRE